MKNKMGESIKRKGSDFGHGLINNESVRDLSRKIEKGEVSGKEEWPVCDSPLLSGPSGEDSEDFRKRMFSYNLNFSWPLIADEKNRKGEEYQNIKEYIEDVLEKKRGKAIGIDFGGPGSWVFRGFEKGFLRRTLGVTLRDEREGEDRKRDDINRHTVIGGNMFRPTTRKKIKQWLNGEKADLIFERMWGGHLHINYDIRFIREVLKQAYFILSEGGVMFLEHSLGRNPVAGENIRKWVSHVNENYKGFIKIVLEPEFGNYGGAFMLRKLKGAPEQLPRTELLRKSAEEDLEPKQSIGTE